MLITAADKDGENIRSLARIAEMHEHRLTDPEGRIPESGKYADHLSGPRGHARAICHEHQWNRCTRALTLQRLSVVGCHGLVERSFSRTWDGWVDHIVRFIHSVNG